MQVSSLLSSLSNSLKKMTETPKMENKEVKPVIVVHECPVMDVVEEKIVYTTKEQEIIDDYYCEVNNLNEFSAWIVRAWFNAEKHGNSVWYDVSITVNNVIFKILRNSKFPYTPSQLVDIWRNLPFLQKDLNNASANDDIQDIENVAIYKKGEQTLSSIGGDLGDISATMVKKLGDTAEEKIKKIYNFKSPEDLLVKEEEELFQVIEDARIEAATTYSTLLKSFNGDIKTFFAELVKRQILSSNEIDLITSDEIQGLTMLSGIDQDIIEEILLTDIEDEENTFKTYQNAVSNIIHPKGKRGRPKKQ